MPLSEFISDAFASPPHRLRRHAMPVLKYPRQFPPHHPAPEKIPQNAKRQFVLNPILQPASLRPIGNEQMGMLPAAKRTRSLHIPKLPALNVTAMFKRPSQAQRPDVNPHRPAVP